ATKGDARRRRRSAGRSSRDDGDRGGRAAERKPAAAARGRKGGATTRACTAAGASAVRSFTEDLGDDAMSAPNRALHVPDQYLGVLTGDTDAPSSLAQHGPERHHLTGAKDGVAAAGEPVI